MVFLPFKIVHSGKYKKIWEGLWTKYCKTRISQIQTHDTTYTYSMPNAAEFPDSLMISDRG